MGSGAYAEATPTYYNGTVYAVSYDGLFAVDPTDGSINWSYTTPTEALWGVKIYNNRAYFTQYGSGDTAKIYAVDLTSHTADWIYSLTTGTIGMIPAIDEETNRLFFSSVDGRLFALNADTGAELWFSENGNTSWGAITIDNDKIFHATQ